MTQKPLSPAMRTFLNAMYRELDYGIPKVGRLRELATMASEQLSHDELALLAMWLVETVCRIAKGRDDMWDIGFPRSDDETGEYQRCDRCGDPIPPGHLVFVPGGNYYEDSVCAFCLPEAVTERELAAVEAIRRFAESVPLRDKPIAPQLRVLAELQAVVDSAT
jgi:hypothetical protein